MIDSNKKGIILKQVDKFYKKTLKEINKARYYVDTETAKEIASFFGKFYREYDLTFDRVIDLTFGSANLTSHILLDNDIDFHTLVLNDKNLDDANKNVEFGDKFNFDILDYDSFEQFDPFDLIIFNPQLGGTAYSKGKLQTDGGLNKDSFCIHKLQLDIEEAFREKFDLSDCEISINPDANNEHKIFIYSSKLTQTQMNNRFGKLQIFNYYDVFYQAEGNEAIGQNSKTVNFRRTLEKIIHDKTIIVFLGDDKYYNIFFADFNNYAKYNFSSDKSIYLGKKDTVLKKECFEKNEEDFVLIDCNQQNIDEMVIDDIDVFKLLDEISNDLMNLKNLNGSEVGIEASIPSIIKTTAVKNNDKPQFKNFLLGFINKEIK